MNTNLIRALLSVVDADPSLRHKVAKMICDHLTSQELTEHEVYLGQTQGKLNVVRAYRDRVGCGLIDAKNFVEKYFSENGYSFAQQQY
jgi:ribosomal protein L7/L12